MNKTIKFYVFFKWIVYEMLWFYIIAQTFYKQSQGFGNVLVFVVWLCFFMAVMMKMEEEKGIKSKPVLDGYRNVVPMLLWAGMDAVKTIILAYNGWFVTAFISYLVFATQAHKYFQEKKGKNETENI